MSIDKVLILDTETGGLDPAKHSLLTAAFVAVDLKKGKILDRLYLQIKHETYHVTPRAMEVNKIDLIKHDKEATPVKEAVGKVVDFIQKNFKGTTPARPGGQNYPFDEGFLKVLFTEAGAKFGDFVHYSYLDTLPVLRLMATFDLIPEAACRLDGARKEFKLPAKKSGQAHHAMTDAEDTINLFAALVDRIQGSGKTVAEQEEAQEISPSAVNVDNENENKEIDDEAEDVPQKRRGRPKGSKNKTNDHAEQQLVKQLPVESDEEDNDDEEDETPQKSPPKISSKKNELDEDDDDEEDDAPAELDVDDDEDEENDDVDDDDDEDLPPAKPVKKVVAKEEPKKEPKEVDDDDEEEEDDFDDWDEEEEEDDK